MMARRHTVYDVIRQAFPDGYRDHARYLRDLETPAKVKKGAKAAAPSLSFDHPPCSAVDLFAVAGQLLLKSGAYHHVSPEVASAVSPEMMIVTAEMRDEWRATGALWRGDPGSNLPAPPAKLVEHWDGLMSFADQPVYKTSGYTAVARKWWAHALALFCIADEAALDIGFQGHGLPSAQAQFIEFPLRARQKTAVTAVARKGPSSFSLSADPDVLAVLPKSRTANVGCTLRSLSHNLSLLPGRGQARAHWSLTPEEQISASKGDSIPFNLVILPMPFGVQAQAFRGFPAEGSKWGWFDVDPHWCPASVRGSEPPKILEFLTFVDAVLDEAARDCGPIHALVFPEVALSDEVFRGLAEHLSDRAGFELLISGLFDGPSPVGDDVRPGNFTGMARFWRTADKKSYDIAIREKHHRWRIDRSQIETYALGSALDVNRGWWEHIDILNRSLDVFVVRGNATVTTLICEDLARNDPCQELVRGIGPNFVVALLMDGPQRKDRWPARYATVLADDPGSSVLSVTSYGLIDRTNQTGAFPPANQIGLFRDDTGKATEIQLPKGSHGVCLTLQPTVLTEHTLDGRPDKGDAQSWRLAAVQPVKASGDYSDILKGQWPGGVT
jgi:hypothetical protein